MSYYFRGIFVLIISVSFSLPAHAKVVGQYRISVEAQNEIGGRWTDLMATALGWRCWASSTLTYSEIQRDHRGEEKRIPQSRASNFGYSAFSNHRVTMDFDSDLTQPSPNTAFTLQENCEKQVTTRDRRGRRHTETLTAYMSWRCTLDQTLPRTVGQTRSSTCAPSGSNFSSLDLESMALMGMKNKQFRANVSMTGSREVFTRDFCGGSRRNRVIIHLSQGVVGHLTEDDFVFNVQIGDQPSFQISSHGGLLNDDIAYCGDANPVRVSVTARTDHYLVTNRDYYGANGVDSVSLSREPGHTVGSIFLKRKTIFGNETTKYDSQVMVTLIDPNSGEPHVSVGRPSLAEAH